MPELFFFTPEAPNGETAPPDPLHPADPESVKVGDAEVPVSYTVPEASGDYPKCRKGHGTMLSGFTRPGEND